MTEPDPPLSYPPIDPETIAPCKKGLPDLYNHMPSRIVKWEEADARGWPYFYDTASCKYGHQAPRFTSNVRLCVDCHRRDNGDKPPIGAKASAGARQYTQRAAPTGATAVVTQKAPEPDATEKKFLESYAATRNMDESARAVRLSRAQVEGRMSYSPVFRDAVHKLEERLGILQTPLITGAFEWTEEKRARLIEVWVDTGDIATAREAIRVTPSEYLRELDRNEAFAEEVSRAEPLANRMLEERAYQMALAGNDKLLTKVLAAKLPGQYRDSLKIDLNQNPASRMDDAQLDARIARLMARRRGTFEDAEIVETKQLTPPTA